MDAKFTVELDVPRSIEWTFGAESRLGSLPRPPLLTDLTNPRKSYFALCAVIWAALPSKDNPFESPDEIAEVLDTTEKVKSAFAVFMDAWRASRPKKVSEEKKASAKPEPSPASSLA